MHTSLPPLSIHQPIRPSIHPSTQDFHADAPQNQHLPHYKKMKDFSKAIFEHCPLLAMISKDQADSMLNNFAFYKHGIPAYGTILLNNSMTKVVLCKSYGGNSWTFPRGKVNENENPLACACRETFEEAGYDPTTHCAGEEDSIIWIDDKKLCKLFIGTNIPEETVFIPQTRKEVSEVAFHEINALVDKNHPKYIKTWGVIPFFQNLKRWISRHRGSNKKGGQAAPEILIEATNRMTAKEKKAREAAAAGVGKLGNASKNPAKGKNKGASSAQTLLDKVNAETFSLSPSAKQRKRSGGIDDDGDKGWSVTDMFKTNEKLMGRKLDTYDGNVHNFGASHPRYVNYSQRDGNNNGKVGGSSGIEGLLPSAGDVVLSYNEVFGLHVGDSKGKPGSFPAVTSNSGAGAVYRPIGTDVRGHAITLFQASGTAATKTKNATRVVSVNPNAGQLFAFNVKAIKLAVSAYARTVQ